MPLIDYPELIANAKDDDNSPSRTYAQEYYSRLGQWCDRAYDEGVALQAEVPELKEISGALDYLMGMQWKQENIPSYRAKPVSNEVAANFWECIGLLTDLKPIFHISDVGSQGGGDYSKIESILNKLAKSWAATTSYQRRMAFCIMFGMLTTAPAKIYWNPFARGWSGDPSDGDITLEALPASSILRVGAGNELQDDEMVIYRRVRTLNWIKRAYPTMGKFVRPEESQGRYTKDVQAPSTVMPQLFQSLSPAMKRMVGGGDQKLSDSVFPRAEVCEFWFKDDSVNESGKKIWMGPKAAEWGYIVAPGQKLYPRGRLIVRANGVTLYDEPNPYWHRKYPFALLGLNEVPWQQYAMSVVSPWMKQQDILNQIMQGLVQCVKKAVNPPLIASKQAIHPEAMRAIDSSKPNLKVTYNGNAGTAPAWGKPPDIPAYALQTYNIIKGAMKQASGASAMDDALSKKQVPGGDSLERIQFSKNTPIRFMGRNVESFSDELGSMWVANALQFYKAEMRMELLGDKGLTKEDTDDRPGSLIPDGVNSEQFIRRYRFKTQPGTMLNLQRQERIPIAFALRKGHDLSRKKLFEVLDWNLNTEENDAELQKEAQQMAAAMPQKPAGKK